jgi:hypothetical protein
VPEMSGKKLRSKSSATATANGAVEGSPPNRHSIHFPDDMDDDLKEFNLKIEDKVVDVSVFSFLLKRLLSKICFN